MFGVDLVGSVKRTTSNKVAWLIERIKKIFVGYQQEGIDPPLGEKPANYGQT